MTGPGRRRRLVPVACRTIQGDPDGVHLAVEEWLPKSREWVTGPALCGRSAEQGALPADTPITCTDLPGSCEAYRDSYQRALDGRPTATQEEIAHLRARVAELEAALGIAGEPIASPLRCRTTASRAAHEAVRTRFGLLLPACGVAGRGTLQLPDGTPLTCPLCDGTIPPLTKDPGGTA